MLTNCLGTCTHLSSTVSQLFEPQLQKIAVFTYRSPHFCFSWRRPCDYHAICCMDRKTIQCLPNPSQHVPIYSIFNSFRVIRWLSQCVRPKITIFTHAKCCMDGKRIRCLEIVSQHVPIYIQQFPSYSNRNCKKSPFSRTAGHIFFIPPLHSTPPLGGFSSEYWHPVWQAKTRMAWLPDGEKISKIFYSFSRNSRTWQTDRRTDGHRVTAIAALCIASHSKNHHDATMFNWTTFNCWFERRRLTNFKTL